MAIIKIIGNNLQKQENIMKSGAKNNAKIVIFLGIALAVGPGMSIPNEYNMIFRAASLIVMMAGVLYLVSTSRR